MFKKLFFILVVLSVMLSIASPSHALWWMVYHKPAFHGRVIDAETKEPIEGGVVVVSYYKNVIRIAPESMSVIVGVREALTNKDGEFYMPSFTRLMDPLSWESYADFIIYKPGYGSYPYWQKSPPKLGVSPEEFFSREPIGTEGEVVWIAERIKVTFGVVELPKLKTREEMERRMLGFPTGFGAKELPLLYKAYEEEKKTFDIKE